MSWKDAPFRRASGEKAEPDHMRQRFPTRSLSLALGLSFVAFLCFAWNAHRSDRLNQAQHNQSVRFEELRGVILHLDEVLTMSGRMAVATGDTRWEQRYRRFEPQLDAAIKEVERLAPRRPEIRRAAEETDKANIELVRMEHHAFGLVRSRQAEQAVVLLLSAAYQEQKQRYAAGIAKVAQLADEQMRLADQLRRRNMGFAMAGALSAVVVAAILWVVAVLNLGRWREDLVTALRERVAAEAAAKRATARLEILRELDTAILGVGTVEEIAMAAVQRLGALIPADRTSLAVFDEEAGLAQVVAAGVLEEELGGSRTIPLVEAFLKLDELRAGEVTRISDLAAMDQLDALSARLREAGIRSMVSVPVRAHGALLGSLNVAATKPAVFSDADIEVAREVADTLAMAVGHARLHQAVARHAEELEAKVAERTGELAARTGEAERLNQAMLNLLEDLRSQQARTDEIARRLEISNRELESFAYSVSHDLRAPLRAIDGFGEALAEDLAGRLDEGQQDDLGRMRAAARRMGSMIDDLLALSRASRVEMEMRQMDLSEVAGEVVDELREGEREREVEVTVGPGLMARGDPRLLRLVLQNLIGNAWKFTRPTQAATIEVGRRHEDGEGVFYVRDNGVGFDMKYAGKLFAPFQRLHRQDEFPGDGIGLATVQRIVARHGGRVWAEAEEGVGATFFFTLLGENTP